MLEEAIEVKSKLHNAIMSGQSLSNVKDSLVEENKYLGGAEILSTAGVLMEYTKMFRDALYSMFGDKRYFCSLLRTKLQGAEALVLLGNHLPCPIVNFDGVREGEVFPVSLAEANTYTWFIEFSIPSTQYGHMTMNRAATTRHMTQELLFSFLRKHEGLFSDSGYELKATRNALEHVVMAEARHVFDQVTDAYCESYRRSLDQVGIHNVSVNYSYQ